MDQEKFKRWKETEAKRPGGTLARLLLGELIQENEALTKMYAARVCRAANQPLEEDAMQAARIGMMLAFQKYQPARASFSTWAWHWVRHEVQKHLAKHSIFTGAKKGVRLPPTALARLRAMQAEGKTPTAEDIGVSEELFLAYQTGGAWIESLEDVAGAFRGASEEWGESLLSDGESPRRQIESEELGPEDNARQRAALERIQEYQDSLPRKERALFAEWLVGHKDERTAARKAGLKGHEARELFTKWKREIYAAVLDWAEN